MTRKSVSRPAAPPARKSAAKLKRQEKKPMPKTNTERLAAKQSKSSAAAKKTRRIRGTSNARSAKALRYWIVSSCTFRRPMANRNTSSKQSWTASPTRTPSTSSRRRL